ncbi:biosynthetic-type acetolactate synthase large subunit [Candidatus Woesearchaeota archaeon]|nr:biosynthetic-type acetolactate synthase large subunit [Candidatus Woesearchaeota archaeon]
MKGSEAIVKTLIGSGVHTTFGFPGGAVIPLFDEFLRFEGKIKNILVRHEQGAAHAADGYARASGKPGICIATSGPGATNLVTGIMTAYMDSSPIIAFGGQVSMSLIGNDAFQEADMMGITLPITKHSFQIKKANDVVPTILKAFRISAEGRPGPVYIDLPKDCQVGEVTKEAPKKVDIPSFKPVYRGNINQIKKAADMILAAERPVVIAGGGTIIANAAKEVTVLMDTFMIPTATTIMGKGIIPEDHPLAIGQVGMHGRKAANYAVINADLVMAVGCRFSDRITGNTSSYAEKAKVIHIDIDAAEIGKNIEVDVPIVGDSKSVLSDLIVVMNEKLKKKTETEWSKRMKELNQLCRCNMDSKKEPIEPKKLLFELNRILKTDDIVVTGVGQHQMFATHFIDRMKPRTFITSGGAGTMGFGLPAAMGAKVAVPDTNVFDIDGDGSFLMNIQELATLKEENIKVIPVVFNNSYLGMVRQWLEIYYSKRYSQVKLGRHSDFVKIAEAFGLGGIRVEKPAKIQDALKESIRSKETMVLDVYVEPESNILPMLPPGGHLKEAFGGCMNAKGVFF